MEPDELKGIPVSEENNALFEYGRNVLLESINIIKDYIRMMIPLTTAVITTYFALLQFLGIETAGGLMNKNFIILPPILLLVSLVSFIVASFPIPKKITITNINSINAYRTAAIRWKYIGTIVGSSLFIIGLLVMILNVNSLL